MDIKLIAADMDGTLLNSKQELPPGFPDTIRKLHQKGICFAAASGRQFINLQKVFAEVADDMVFIAENGSLVAKGRQVIYTLPVPEHRLEDIYNTADAIPGTTVLLCGTKAAYLKHPDAMADEHSARYYTSRVFSDDPLRTVKEHGDAIIKVAIFHEEDGALCRTPMEKFSAELKLTLAAKNWLDVSHPDVNKGTAMSFLLKDFGLTPENCMAFGDYPNDTELLKSVYYSYAMANAVQSIKDIARFEAPSNDDFGVAQVIRQYFPEL